MWTLVVLLSIIWLVMLQQVSRPRVTMLKLGLVW